MLRRRCTLPALLYIVFSRMKSLVVFREGSEVLRGLLVWYFPALLVISSVIEPTLIKRVPSLLSDGKSFANFLMLVWGYPPIIIGLIYLLTRQSGESCFTQWRNASLCFIISGAFWSSFFKTGRELFRGLGTNYKEDWLQLGCCSNKVVE